ncbi:MAG: protein-disulfide reductase DsbD domain-containing protein [Planctomycetota bacterium]|jgi:thiol:disulfide interchange protein DsbD
MNPRPLFPLLLTAFLLAHLAPTARAEPAATPQAGPGEVDRLVKLRLASDVDRIEPGATFHLAVIFEIAKHWHTYWVDPGAGGAAPELEIKAPEGFKVGATKFPRPRAFPGPEGPEYGYEKETVLFVPVTAPKELTDGHASFEVGVFFLVCRDVCLLGDKNLSVRVPTASRRTGKAKLPGGRDGRRIEQFQRRVPKPITTLAGARAAFDGKTLTVEGPVKAGAKLSVYPIQSPGIEYGKVAMEIADGRFVLTAPVEVSPQNALGEPLIVQGVVAFGPKPEAPCYSWRIPVKAVPAAKLQPPPKKRHWRD